MAVPNGHFTSRVLGIKSVVHKKKLALKAMDIVMFGPAKGLPHSPHPVSSISVNLIFNRCCGQCNIRIFNRKGLKPRPNIYLRLILI